jgi:hypothetical protein
MDECLIVFQDSNMSFDSVVARVVVGKPIDTQNNTNDEDFKRKNEETKTRTLPSRIKDE